MRAQQDKLLSYLLWNTYMNNIIDTKSDPNNFSNEWKPPTQQEVMQNILEQIGVHYTNAL